MTDTATILDARPHMEKIATGLSEGYRREMSGTLSDILTETYRLVIKSQVYHWNVVGPLFRSLHLLTEEHYTKLFAAADVIAERIRALGHLAPVSFGAAPDFAPTAAAVEHDTAREMIEDLIADHESACRHIRDAAEKADKAGDLVTADMLTDRLAFHEKAIWMLGAIVAD